ncbi:conserved protein of unknown function [Acidithiobacillus ferrivorans]|uniref:Phosphoribosylanthranilate isomerase n=1 Tax=Acidithiobacillus ferrivorans TaxID=160808 RepID=A0A060UQF8_9PROT|nr:hypothetical protein [Acidithiobacillus ferrivorans]CDQ10685.1 conserved hypothetical protein [Acidithiobacillus ferrivorans]SMH64712.1 conserved protein of unknown function [Acidithiobacillus ferrivorans]
MPVTKITLTGVDENTDLRLLGPLSETHPVEWGFLYSPKQQGEPGRYPSIYFLKKAFALLPPSLHISLHICGKGVNDILTAEPVATALVELLAQRNGRLQLNFNHRKRPVDLPALAKFITCNPNLPVITQIHNGNSEVQPGLFKILGTAPTNHQMLFDASGGRGQVATILEAPRYGVHCGYAGGIGPDNIVERITAINTFVGDLDTWIDMESSLRTTTGDTDWFDLQKCRATLKTFQEIRPAQKGTEINECKPI